MPIVVPGITSLSLPLTIRYRLRWKPLAICLSPAIFYLFLHLFARVIWSSTIPPYMAIAGDWIFATIFAVLIWISIWNIESSVVADEMGFSVYWGKRRLKHIPWNEALLFAIVYTRGLFYSTTPRMFELASEREIIRWQGQSGHFRRDWQFSRARMTPEQYAFVIQELQTIIAEKTGLPLYDLRKK
jgi:hypothetical protein